jgi:hypothetical protein
VSHTQAIYPQVEKSNRIALNKEMIESAGRSAESLS